MITTKPRLLLIEDDPELGPLITGVLEESYSVELVADGQAEYWLPREPRVVRVSAASPNHGSCRSEPRLAWLRAT